MKNEISMRKVKRKDGANTKCFYISSWADLFQAKLKNKMNTIRVTTTHYIQRPVFLLSPDVDIHVNSYSAIPAIRFFLNKWFIHMRI